MYEPPFADERPTLLKKTAAGMSHDPIPLVPHGKTPGPYFSACQQDCELSMWKIARLSM